LLTVWRLAFVADFGTQNINLKTKFDMEHKTSIKHENGNDANRLLAAGWIRCTETLPPLRKRVIVTDGVISTIGWISNYRKGWEGWVTLDNEYLNDIVAWQEFPPACS